MTIFTFCRDQVLADGPLSLEEPTERAVAAGVTRSQQPMSTVRSTISHRLIALPGERWASALPLLEGRVLTTRSFGTRGPDDARDGNRSGFDLGLLS
jgi:hypothetical protein